MPKKTKCRIGFVGNFNTLSSSAKVLKID